MFSTNRQQEHRAIITMMREGKFKLKVEDSKKYSYALYLTQNMDSAKQLLTKFNVSKIRSISPLVWKRLEQFARSDNCVKDYRISNTDAIRWLRDPDWDFKPKHPVSAY